MLSYKQICSKYLLIKLQHFFREEINMGRHSVTKQTGDENVKGKEDRSE